MEDISKENEQLNNEENSSLEAPKKPKSVKKNYFYNLLYQLFLLIVPLITTPYVSRVLGAEGVGKYSFSFSIITYFTIFGALGFGYYAQREIAKHQDDKHGQIVSFFEIFICRLIPIFIALAVNLIFCFTNIYKEYTNLMLIFNINIVALAFDIAFLYQGKEEFGKLVIRNFIVKLLSVISIFVFVKTKDDIAIYALINALSVIFGNLFIWITLPKYIEKIRIKELRPLRHLKGTIVLFLPTVAVSIYTILDKTLIGLLITDTYTDIVDGKEVIKRYSDLENGYYEQSEKIVKMVMTVITAIGTVMIPRNTHEYSIGNHEKVKENIFTSCTLILMLGIPLALGLVVIADNFIPWFFGDGYDKCILLMKILSPLILIIGFSNVFGLQYLIPTGKDKRFTIALIVGAITNFLLNLIFIHFWWSVGASIATIVAEATVTLIMAIMVRKEINFLKLFISAWRYYIAGIVMFFACYFVARNLESSIINTILIALIGAIIYFVILIILQDKLIINTIKKIFKKLKKN